MPGVIAIVAPLLVGFLFGTEALGGLIGGSLASGVLVAILMLTPAVHGITRRNS